jgi:hypothetical protein
LKRLGSFSTARGEVFMSMVVSPCQIASIDRSNGEACFWTGERHSGGKIAKICQSL